MNEITMSWDEAIAAFLMVFLRHGTDKFAKEEVIAIKEILYLKKLPLKGESDWNYLLSLIQKLQVRASKEGTIRHILRDAVLHLTDEMTSTEKYLLRSALRSIASACGGIKSENVAVMNLFNQFVQAKEEK